jgi:hypothetical protein
MTDLKERFVVYVDIGHLPGRQAADYVQEVREKWVMEAKLKGDDAWWYFIGVRSDGDVSATRVHRL